MKISEGVYTYEEDGVFVWKCRPCGIRFGGYPVHEAARIDARDHFATTPHLLALKERRSTEQLIDALFAVVGIGEQ